MSVVVRLSTTVQTVVVPLLLNPRAQAVAALALALAGGLLLGPDGVDARQGVIGSGGRR